MRASTVEVRAFFDLADDRERTKTFDLAAEAGTVTVASLIGRAGIAAQRVGLVMVNGRVADQDRLVTAGDRVALFPEYVPFHKVYGMCVL